jgi:cell wall-associated NlpC family hydrolase
VTPGQTAVVAVPVATLWRAPDRLRPIDQDAADAQPNLAAWARMSADEQDDLNGRTDSQLLYGDPVLVDEVSDGWVRCVALGQGSKHDPRGYPGWIPAAQLIDGAAAKPTHIVDAISTDLRAGLDGAVVVAGIVLGTRLAAVGPAAGGWLPVSVPGGVAWVPEPAVVPYPPANSEGDPVAVAERLLGVRYIWGGVSPYGIDCSGLVHLSFRRLGVTLPRDASDQANATRPLAFGEERRGDLYFFAKAGRGITHVGFVAAPPGADGTRHMVHASGSQKVISEPVSGEREHTLVAVHRV